ncbi:putative Auxin response factor 17 [Hibiscus syriacus]|uniref:GrpE protein homolog n=1 Tax=Hibiscus syriacus TaxID=106335 RepID=A0A6A2WYF8_HIBSY|nr:protein GrpE-like [Hibiscus syriacus]KAE8666611.1 putative Auxin response factor 17 [Hibiscus syriacus]
MNCTKCPNRSILKASLSAQESARTENVKILGGSLKGMIRVYNEALLSGDDRIVAEIENRISILENEKNGLEKQVLELSAEITSGKEMYIRLHADFDNFRKKSEKERLTTRSDAQGEVIESLLPMVDSFERAKQQIKPETEKEKKIDTSYQGIYKQFVEIMRSLQVAVVPTVGKPFDPSLHEAIAREESLEFKEGIITHEFRRGFLLGERLLRPAMVKVSSGPGNKKVTVATDRSSGQPTAGDDQ